MAQGHAFEHGEGLWHGRKLMCLRGWRWTLTQGWCVAREVWDAGDEPAAEVALGAGACPVALSAMRFAA